MPRYTLVVALVALLLAAPSLGFSVVPATTSESAVSSTSLNVFGKAFGDAFKNDDSLGKAENAGLKGVRPDFAFFWCVGLHEAHHSHSRFVAQGPKYNEQVTINGKPIKAVVGQAVKQVANSARVKIRYDCQQGDCGTCMIKMNGKTVKACQMKIPSGRCVIQTLD
jgi:ferredoxin